MVKKILIGAFMTLLLGNSLSAAYLCVQNRLPFGSGQDGTPTSAGSSQQPASPGGQAVESSDTSSSESSSIPEKVHTGRPPGYDPTAGPDLL